MKGLIYAAIGAYVVVISIMLFIYFRPKFINEKFTQEGFTTIAIDGVVACIGAVNVRCQMRHRAPTANELASERVYLGGAYQEPGEDEPADLHEKAMAGAA